MKLNFYIGFSFLFLVLFFSSCKKKNDTGYKHIHYYIITRAEITTYSNNMDTVIKTEVYDSIPGRFIFSRKSISAIVEINYPSLALVNDQHALWERHECNPEILYIWSGLGYRKFTVKDPKKKHQEWSIILGGGSRIFIERIYVEEQ